MSLWSAGLLGADTDPTPAACAATHALQLRLRVFPAILFGAGPLESPCAGICPKYSFNGENILWMARAWPSAQRPLDTVARIRSGARAAVRLSQQRWESPWASSVAIPRVAAFCGRACGRDEPLRPFLVLCARRVSRNGYEASSRETRLR